jgi:YVTN family beta-propeller protein
VTRIPVADDPDGIFYISANHSIYVASGDGKTATLIDPATQKVSATIPLDGKPEFGVFDTQTNLFYQNLEDTSSLAAVDLSKRAVTTRWPLQDCVHPTGMALDEQSRQLFIGCSGNSRLAVFELERHNVITTVPVGGGPDSVAYDAELHRIYVTGRSGVLCVVERDNNGAFAVVDKISLHYGAHTLAVDPTSHRLYVAYASLFIPPRIAVFSPLGPITLRDSSPLPEWERIEGEGPYPARSSARDSRFCLRSESAQVPSNLPDLGDEHFSLIEPDFPCYSCCVDEPSRCEISSP